MSENLSTDELEAMIQRVFQPQPEDRAIAIMLDLPDEKVADNPDWAARRQMAAGWAAALAGSAPRLGLPVALVLYRNAHMNNADLPEKAWLHTGPLPAEARELDSAAAISFDAIFESHRILIAPTEFSATAPLKLAARSAGIRAATMPGFSESMIPALRLDYEEINRRVEFMTDRLSSACAAEISFLVDGSSEYELLLDLRHRSGHASGGMFPSPGQAGNLPSGESYIVPYEGELEGDPTRSAGRLPVQFGGEVVVYRIADNRAQEVLSQGEASQREARRIEAEPAYGNLAELGLGVLSDFGLEPTGETLLDEKLGLHIAFGRSDHFGGQVGAAQFSSPEAVVHIDRVYIPAIQPRVSLARADLIMEDGSRLELIRAGVYTVVFPQAC